jgi:gamma-glutamyltranspeptidase/glutathione hydrolase
MVATSNPLAAEAARWALAEGGTAMDAAIASDAVLGVVQPQSTGVGGDLFCIVDDGREVVGFNGSGAAPAALTLDACRGWSDTSPLTVTVPGTVDGWFQLSARFGRLGVARALEPARRLAADGFAVTPVSARDWTAHTSRLRVGSPFAAEVLPGQRVVNPALAATLAAVTDHYTGAFAHAAVAAVVADGGVLAMEDLVAHEGEWVTPISGSYRGTEVVQLPPNGQGVAVLEALRLLDDRPAPDLGALMVATRDGMQHAYATVADPRTVVGRDTVYTAVVAGGMAVSLISSVFTGFGSGITAGGAALQNRGFGFSLDAASPNAVAGGKRPFHTIIPSMLRRNGRLAAVFAVVGGPMQPQGQVQVLSHLLDHGLDPQPALDAPRAFWWGDGVIVEPGFSEEALEALRGAGLGRVDEVADDRYFGVGQIVAVGPDGSLTGATDARHDGVVLSI